MHKNTLNRSSYLELFAERLARGSRQTQLRAPQRRLNAVFAERLEALGKYLCSRQRKLRREKLCRVSFAESPLSAKLFAESTRLTAKSLDPVLKKYIDTTLGQGDLREAVRLPIGENLNEWLAVNSKF
ncbi:hypothetical protein HU200_034984 [Digitaria exilis]|uniref:Uncharacterized protein n=1 Tax=Digitaria exilis TaxID=1010633 RepID=A0A835EJD5_9POAL|nr:hypothetical protein HU200_034984 [Digitaria exilis]